MTTIKEFLDMCMVLPYGVRIYNYEDEELKYPLYEGFTPLHIPSDISEKKLHCFNFFPNYSQNGNDLGTFMLFVKENKND